ncbi:MAG: hypothetical protein AABX25_00170 [Nanoarchaeota archaeon]
MEESKRDNIKNSLLTVLCNATGIYRRTITAEQKKNYQIKLKEIIMRLTKKVDSDSITNKDIRNAIIELREFCGSIGASQKAINVYLKFYSVISNKKDLVLRELDCPIDSFVIKKNKLKKIALSNLNLEDYEEMQNKLNQKYEMRILADIEAWDIKKEY